MISLGLMEVVIFPSGFGSLESGVWVFVPGWRCSWRKTVLAFPLLLLTFFSFFFFFLLPFSPSYFALGAFDRAVRSIHQVSLGLGHGGGDDDGAACSTSTASERAMDQAGKAVCGRETAGFSRYHYVLMIGRGNTGWQACRHSGRFCRWWWDGEM
ncbi:hypothetical protein BC567DRAFT_239025, partial [Phyllosticta citribraziliensis]